VVTYDPARVTPDSMIAELSAMAGYRATVIETSDD